MNINVSKAFELLAGELLDNSEKNSVTNKKTGKNLGVGISLEKKKDNKTRCCGLV